MIGKHTLFFKPVCLMAASVLFAGLLLAGCSGNNDEGQTVVPPKGSVGVKGAVNGAPPPAPTGEAAKTLTEQQQAVSVEKSDGGTAPK